MLLHGAMTSILARILKNGIMIIGKKKKTSTHATTHTILNVHVGSTIRSTSVFTIMTLVSIIIMIIKKVIRIIPIVCITNNSIPMVIMTMGNIEENIAVFHIHPQNLIFATTDSV